MPWCQVARLNCFEKDKVQKGVVPEGDWFNWTVKLTDKWIDQRSLTLVYNTRLGTFLTRHFLTKILKPIFFGDIQSQFLKHSFFWLYHWRSTSYEPNFFKFFLFSLFSLISHFIALQCRVKTTILMKDFSVGFKLLGNF